MLLNQFHTSKIYNLVWVKRNDLPCLTLNGFRSVPCYYILGKSSPVNSYNTVNSNFDFTYCYQNTRLWTINPYRFSPMYLSFSVTRIWLKNSCCQNTDSKSFVINHRKSIRGIMVATNIFAVMKWKEQPIVVSKLLLYWWEMVLISMVLFNLISVMWIVFMIYLKTSYSFQIEFVTDS